ncbi:MAG TPA: flavocytochrome c [Syntrophorhabdaceae bacterium]|nr:flavocytochrome c [Syntrophorhabdaceae bacterium]HPP41718.1 flavocytochrome c [Syntrophorhabdaceae bacterium]HQK46181.1 flavocytochrome c [Syntrophorhabdaceae bacterium]HRR70686.1 flavocytochrome c [Syntrophorhabdaceae bacterium]
MYLENIKVRVSSEKERELKEFLKDISGHILEHKGLYRFDFFRNTTVSSDFIIQLCWREKIDLSFGSNLAYEILEGLQRIGLTNYTIWAKEIITSDSHLYDDTKENAADCNDKTNKIKEEVSMERKEDEKGVANKVTRRGFLKAGVSAGMLAAATGLALDLSKKDAEAAERKLPKKWDEEIDVVIVGSGFAGLAAAAEAGKKGAKVVILEKMPTYGGNSIINGGVYAAWDSKLHLRQKKNLGDDSPTQHFNDTLKGGDYYNIPSLVKNLTEGAADALNWMIDEGGCRLRDALTRAGGHSAYRTHTVVEGVGKGFTEPLRKIAEKYGAKIRLNNEITWIWRKDTEGPVLGVEVKTPKGKRNIKVKKALILASGGFSRDIKMRQAFNPSVIPDYNSTNHPGATGECIRFAQAIGADTLQMAFIQLYPFAEPETGILDNPAVYPFNGVGYGLIYVDKNGKRFVNELERRDVCSMAQIKLGQKPTYSIFNEEMVTKMGGTMEEIQKGMAKGRFIKADTIEELANKLKIPAQNLVETVKKYNQYIKDGKDPDFNKPITKAMIPLEKGPFYAVAQWPAVHHTMGGIRINEKAQVIDIWGKVIPKFYAAGEVTGGVHGSNRLGSNAIPDCVVHGRIAGINAAQEKA